MYKLPQEEDSCTLYLRSLDVISSLSPVLDSGRYACESLRSVFEERAQVRVRYHNEPEGRFGIDEPAARTGA